MGGGFVKHALSVVSPKSERVEELAGYEHQLRSLEAKHGPAVFVLGKGMFFFFCCAIGCLALPSNLRSGSFFQHSEANQQLMSELKAARAEIAALKYVTIHHPPRLSTTAIQPTNIPPPLGRPTQNCRRSQVQRR